MRRPPTLGESRIEAVVDWFHDRGYEVIFVRGGESAIHLSGGEVVIDSSPSLECRLHTLLHEAGHLLMSKRKGYQQEYSHGWPSKYENRRNVARTDRHRVHTLDEEIGAWKAGLGLAKRLKIHIRAEAYERNRTEAIMSYIDWAWKTSKRGKRKAKARTS